MTTINKVNKTETTVDRRVQIRQILEADGVVNSNQLAEMFNVSLMTIYRDLDSLQEQGIAKRQHGGAVLASRFIPAARQGQKAIRNLEAKRTIGRYAAQNLVSPQDDTIIISNGSTTLEFVRQFPDIPINVMANSLEALSILGTHTYTNLYSLGGELRKDVMAFGGAMTYENLNNCHFSKAFIGVDGIEFSAGLTGTNELSARIARQITERADQVIVLTDNSKFGEVSFRKVCTVDAINTIVTNKGVSQEYKDFLSENNVELIEV